MPQPGNRPDFNLSALNKGTEHKGRVGVAWLKEDGSISIKLNSFVVLSACDDLLLTLFPVDEYENSSERKKPGKKGTIPIRQKPRVLADPETLEEMTEPPPF